MIVWGLALALALLPTASSLVGSGAAWPGKGVNISSSQLPTCDGLVEGKKHLSFPQGLLDFPSPVCPSLGFGASPTLLKGCFISDPVEFDTSLGKQQIRSLGTGFMNPRNGSSDPEKGTSFPPAVASPPHLRMLGM